MIYFIRQVSTGYIKIGCSVRPFARMQSLKMKFGATRMLGVMLGDKEIEEAHHHRFDHLNVNHFGETTYGNEWFIPGRVLQLYIHKETSLELLDTHLSKFDGRCQKRYIDVFDRQLLERYQVYQAQHEDVV